MGDIVQVIAEAAADRQAQELAAVESETLPPALPSGLSTTTVCAPAQPTAASVSGRLRSWTVIVAIGSSLKPSEPR
jgi:hypothetical protein